jgi:hypothetical protein
LVAVGSGNGRVRSRPAVSFITRSSNFKPALV